MTVPNNANTYLPGTIQIPSALLITAITQDFPAVITAEVDDVTASNTYIAGQQITLTIPFEYGMQQANGLTVKILSIDDLDFYVDMNSRSFDAFKIFSFMRKTRQIGIRAIFFFHTRCSFNAKTI